MAPSVEYSVDCNGLVKNSADCNRSVEYNADCNRLVEYSVDCNRSVEYSVECNRSVEYSVDCNPPSVTSIGSVDAENIPIVAICPVSGWRGGGVTNLPRYTSYLSPKDNRNNDRKILYP